MRNNVISNACFCVRTYDRTCENGSNGGLEWKDYCREHHHLLPCDRKGFVVVNWLRFPDQEWWVLMCEEYYKSCLFHNFSEPRCGRYWFLRVDFVVGNWNKLPKKIGFGRKKNQFGPQCVHTWANGIDHTSLY